MIGKSEILDNNIKCFYSNESLAPYKSITLYFKSLLKFYRIIGSLNMKDNSILINNSLRQNLRVGLK